jgi:hypothetical protein
MVVLKRERRMDKEVEIIGKEISNNFGILCMFYTNQITLQPRCGIMQMPYPGTVMNKIIQHKFRDEGGPRQGPSCGNSISKSNSRLLQTRILRSGEEISRQIRLVSPYRYAFSVSCWKGPKCRNIDGILDKDLT